MKACTVALILKGSEGEWDGMGRIVLSLQRRKDMTMDGWLGVGLLSQ